MIFFLVYREGREFLFFWDLGVLEVDYFLGFGDFVGELRRYFLFLFIDGKVEEVEEVYCFMEELYGEFMMFEYFKGFVNIRMK